MSDVIDFNDLRNKITPKEEEDFREFIFNLYNDISNGEIFVSELNEKIQEYSHNKGFSKTKLDKLRGNLVKELTKEAGAALQSFDFDEIAIKSVQKYTVFNGLNHAEVILEGGQAFIISENEPNFQDDELEGIISKYKEMSGLKQVQVVYMKEMKRFMK